MKYFRKVILLIGLLAMLCIGVKAAPYTFTTMDATCQVDSNGVCRFSVTGVVKFHQSVTEFVIPLGQNVSNAEAEIYNTAVRKIDGVSALVFEREAGFDGEMNVTWHYTVRNTVATSADKQIFSVPLLAAQDGDVVLVISGNEERVIGLKDVVLDLGHVAHEAREVDSGVPVDGVTVEEAWLVRAGGLFSGVDERGALLEVEHRRVVA